MGTNQPTREELERAREKAIELLADPAKDGTYKEYAKAAGCSEKTLRAWRDDPQFVDLVEARCREIIREDYLPAVARRMQRKALAGDVSAARLMAQLADVLTPTGSIVRPGTMDGVTREQILEAAASKLTFEQIGRYAVSKKNEAVLAGLRREVEKRDGPGGWAAFKDRVLHADIWHLAEYLDRRTRGEWRKYAKLVLEGTEADGPENYGAYVVDVDDPRPAWEDPFPDDRLRSREAESHAELDARYDAIRDKQEGRVRERIDGALTEAAESADTRRMEKLAKQLGEEHGKNVARLEEKAEEIKRLAEKQKRAEARAERERRAAIEAERRRKVKEHLEWVAEMRRKETMFEGNYGFPSEPE